MPRGSQQQSSQSQHKGGCRSCDFGLHDCRDLAPSSLLLLIDSRLDPQTGRGKRARDDGSDDGDNEYSQNFSQQASQVSLAS